MNVSSLRNFLFVGAALTGAAFVAFAAVVLAAFFAGAEPLADLAAGAFVAAVLVAVRFTG